MVRSSALTTMILSAPLLVAGCYIYTDDPSDPGGTSWGGGPYPPSGGTPVPRPDAASAPAYPPGAGAPPSCPGPTVDRWKELLIIDPSVVQDSRARNDAADGPWSFRRHLEELAGDRASAGDLAWTWLNSWRWGYSVSALPGIANAPRVAVTPRSSVDTELLCPWLRQSPGNACTPTCTSCNDRRLDLARAPFRLIAIVNRMDLGHREGACGRDGGELRFVYTAVAAGGAPLPFTVIFEYQVALPAGQDRRSWAQGWRALGRRPFGPDFNARLAALVAQGMRGASLRRVQTNEIALGQPLGLPWEMRQFVPLAPERGGVLLEPTAVAHTPRLSLDGTEELALFLQQNRLAILEGDNLLTPDMLAGSALLDRADFRWQAPGADPAVLQAFNANTCNGCHGGRGEAGDLPFQHVASGSSSYYPGAPGSTRVSRYLHDPGHPDDELSRRGHLLEEAACSSCPYSRP
jgi:hypothetical protein